MKEIVVLQQPTKPVPVVVPPAVPAEANAPGAWIAQEQAEATPARTKMAAPIPTDPSAPRATTAEILWKQILRSPDSVRTAVILREIFGPPRGLQQF